LPYIPPASLQKKKRTLGKKEGRKEEDSFLGSNTWKGRGKTEKEGGGKRRGEKGESDFPILPPDWLEKKKGKGKKKKRGKREGKKSRPFLPMISSRNGRGKGKAAGGRKGRQAPSRSIIDDVGGKKKKKGL